jgi:hypothetical protein
MVVWVLVALQALLAMTVILFRLRCGWSVVAAIHNIGKNGSEQLPVVLEMKSWLLILSTQKVRCQITYLMVSAPVVVDVFCAVVPGSVLPVGHVLLEHLAQAGVDVVAGAVAVGGAGFIATLLRLVCCTHFGDDFVREGTLFTNQPQTLK